MAHIDDHGVKIWYEVTGQGEPVVLTGGWGLLHDQWHAVRPLLANKIQMIDWNYRGTGHSTRQLTGPLTFDRMVEDLLLVIDHLSIEKVHLWGTSSGATISTAFAARHPDRVKTLVAFPSFAYTEQSRKKSSTYVNLVRDFGYVPLGKFTQWIGCGEKNKFGAEGDAIAQFEAEAFERNFTVEDLQIAIDAIYSTDLTEEVRTLQIPVLMLLGSSGENGADNPNIRASLDTFAQLYPQTEIQTIEDVGGTYMVIEAPETTAKMFMEWIKRHEDR